MSEGDFLASNLAAKLLAGRWRQDDIATRCGEIFGRAQRSLQGKLIAQLLLRWREPYPPDPAWLTEYFRGSEWFERLVRHRLQWDEPIHAVLEPPAFNPAPRFDELDVPVLTSPGDVALWLGIPLAHLDWWADLKRQAERTDIPILRNYHYAFVPKRSGPPRLIEEPKPKLKAAQRLILREILDHVPAHERAHGFVAGRSPLTSASAHAGEDVVVAMDLESFFTRTPLRRVHGVFRSLGYPWVVARVLTGICSASTPVSVFRRLPPDQRHDRFTQQLFASPHLPQGAPTSPALANLAAWRLDARLAGLARSLDANYTRYADDMAFSGGEALARRIGTLIAATGTIAEEEGWTINAAKTRVMRRGGAQRIMGLVVNDLLNVPRASYDELKAILHNCVRKGPDGENRAGHPDFRAHLAGRVAWVASVNPRRGAKLRALLDSIRWDGAAS